MTFHPPYRRPYVRPLTWRTPWWPSPSYSRCPARVTVGCPGPSGHAVTSTVSNSGSASVGPSVRTSGTVPVDPRRFRTAKPRVGVSTFHALKYKLNNRVLRRWFFFLCSLLDDFGFFFNKKNQNYKKSK